MLNVGKGLSVTLTSGEQHVNVTLNVSKGCLHYINNERTTWKCYTECRQRVVCITSTTREQRGNITLNVDKRLSALR